MKEFSGFPEETVRFFEDLSRNNNKAWFADHKPEFESSVIAPAREFVEAMGQKLMKLAPGIIADPRVNGSIFRIYRDIRFSKDKTPYKTHLGIFLWEGERPKKECSGFYVHLEPPNLILGVGIYNFSKPLLEEYRKSAVHPKHGAALAEAVNDVSEDYVVGVQHYKRVPRGFDPDHENAQLLLHNGLTALEMTPIPKELNTSVFVDYCYESFSDMAPIHFWLRDMVKRAGA